MDVKSTDKKYERKIKELSLLFDVSQQLDKSMDLRDVVHPVLKSIAEHMGMLRGTITLLNRDTNEIYIDAAYGLSKLQLEKGFYKLGEGVTGKVIQTGTPALVPKISDEPLFLDKTGARADIDKASISFICVPIKIGDFTIGALSADRLFNDSIELNEDFRLLSIIASMISRAMQLRKEANEERARLLDENTRLQEELKKRFKPQNIIGNSKEMQKVYDLIAQVTGSEATVLILGESGTGKELIAHAIHYNSQRSKFPFIKVNCAALPESIIESELFGHEKGSFTGAHANRKGRFELADGGTIFLDEIGDISPLIQIKLLRVLQEKEFERVGGIDTIKVNVRVITATNRDLEKLVEKEKFRMDLFYRLNVFPLRVPSLRERKADIILLADYFVKKYGKQNNKDIKRISTGAIDMLMSYHWPGNVRELENCIERAVILSTDDVIHGHHLPPSLQTAEASGTRYAGSLVTALDNFEHEMIIEALKSSRGNMAKAAKTLGITERQMGLRVEKYGIDYRRFRG
ncbi:MAG: sigma 54-interacting transcriptional regulator [Spirochaetales bacterium]|nr:sigma 54-interacting transcriptional regulator [Spirochaetales bacterium]